MEQFLASVEKKAFRMAEISTKNADDAFDIVQDAMMKLVQKYSDKPRDEWAPLFYRILQSRITDFHRHSSRQKRWLGWLVKDEESDSPDGYLDKVAGHQQNDPDHLLGLAQETTQLVEHLKALPNRQQQAFMLRAWQGFDTKETAKAMSCSEGSVKTHYSRAIHKLKLKLTEDEVAVS